MAGITDLPYRRVMKAFGAALVFSEMVSANGVVRNGTRSLELVNSSADERPLAIQIFGDDPQQLADTAKLLEERAELIDINCGCPVNKVIRSGAGSALMREPARIGKIVATVRKAVSVPLTIKIRAGWDHATLNYLEVARIAATEGADAITLHPRTRSQGFSGKADWALIGDLKAELDIPVIGSGDILTAADAERMLSETGCDAVMIGRGGYGNPWLIRNILRPTGLGYSTPTEGMRLRTSSAADPMV
jgi:nifR3 family TIM-barrel protein